MKSIACTMYICLFNLRLGNYIEQGLVFSRVRPIGYNEHNKKIIVSMDEKETVSHKRKSNCCASSWVPFPQKAFNFMNQAFFDDKLNFKGEK